jgi:hypothetical protein
VSNYISVFRLSLLVYFLLSYLYRIFVSLFCFSSKLLPASDFNLQVDIEFLRISSASNNRRPCWLPVYVISVSVCVRENFERDHILMCSKNRNETKIFTGWS